MNWFWSKHKLSGTDYGISIAFTLFCSSIGTNYELKGNSTQIYWVWDYIICLSFHLNLWYRVWDNITNGDTSWKIGVHSKEFNNQWDTSLCDMVC